MKKLLLLTTLFTIVFFSCTKKDNEEIYAPGTLCIIKNDSVSQYLQGAESWNVEYYEEDLATPVATLPSDNFEFIDGPNTRDSLKTNSSTQVCLVLDCGNTLYVGSSTQTQFPLILKAQSSFRFTRSYQSRTIVGIASRN